MAMMESEQEALRRRVPRTELLGSDRDGRLYWALPIAPDGAASPAGEPTATAKAAAAAAAAAAAQTGAAAANGGTPGGGASLAPPGVWIEPPDVTRRDVAGRSDAVGGHAKRSAKAAKAKLPKPTPKASAAEASAASTPSLPSLRKDWQVGGQRWSAHAPAHTRARPHAPTPARPHAPTHARTHPPTPAHARPRPHTTCTAAAHRDPIYPPPAFTPLSTHA